MKSVVVVAALLSVGAAQSQTPSQLTLRCEMRDVLERPSGLEFYSLDVNRRLWCRMVNQQCERLNDLVGADANRIKLSYSIEVDRMTGRLTNTANSTTGQCSPTTYQPLPTRQRF